MKHIITSLLLCAAFGLTSIVPTPSYAQSQAEMNQQAAKDFDVADAAMNEAYKPFMHKIDKEAQTKLKSAQRAWVAFRDTQAELEADLAARGGSMVPMIYNGCRTEITKARTKELQKLLKDYGS
jgi:uncharacterized protein YecT (DUF1311 family)